MNKSMPAKGTASQVKIRPSPPFDLKALLDINHKKRKEGLDEIPRNPLIMVPRAGIGLARGELRGILCNQLYFWLLWGMWWRGSSGSGILREMVQEQLGF